MYKILIVDDEEKIRSFVKKYAVFEGHLITEAGDGMEAVEICKKQDFDIIILDIMMPELYISAYSFHKLKFSKNKSRYILCMCVVRSTKSHAP
jgi:CheY-like chemotaxis protein